MPDLNWRPPAWKAETLAAELIARNGAPARNRTGDILFTRKALYRLSYQGQNFRE